LLLTYECEDDTSENIVVDVTDASKPLCVFDPVAKTTPGGVKIQKNDNDQTELKLQDVIYYTPLYHVDTSQGVPLQYKIRMTVLGHYTLLFGSLRQQELYSVPNELSGFTVPGTYLNLGYYWSEAESAFVHPECTPSGASTVVGCTFNIGTVVDSTYNGLLMPCRYTTSVAECSDNLFTSRQSFDGLINVHEFIKPFVTSITVDHVTNLGLLAARTHVASEPVHIAMLGQSCYNNGPTNQYLIQSLQFSGPEEFFQIHVRKLEYVTSLRVVSFLQYTGCDLIPDDKLPGPQCGTVDATQVAGGIFRVTTANKVDMSQCKLDGVTTSCIEAINAANGAGATGRRVRVYYTITQNGQEFVRMHSIDCDTSAVLCTLGFEQGLVDRLTQCVDTDATGNVVSVNMKTDLVAKALTAVAVPAATTLQGILPCRSDQGTPGLPVCPAMLHDQCIASDDGVPSVQHILKTCGKVYSGVSTVELRGSGGGDPPTDPVLSGEPATVLGNGMGYLHLGAVAGPATMPSSIGEAARHMIFPVGVDVTIGCEDSGVIQPHDRITVMGGKKSDNSGWNMDETTWVDVLGMDEYRYTDVKELVENTDDGGVIWGSLRVASSETTTVGGYSTLGHAGINSRTWHEFTSNCATNDVKEYTFASSIDQANHCVRYKNSNQCNDPEGNEVAGTDAQGMVTLNNDGAVGHGLDCTTVGTNGPAMVVEFNDQRPQWQSHGADGIPATGSGLLADAQEVTLCDESHEGQALQHSVCDYSVDEDPHDICSTATGYRGCVFDPMVDPDLDDTGTSFFDNWLENSVDSAGSNRATVLSAVGVLINAAYLSQTAVCGDGATVWGIDVDYVHLGGITPSVAGHRRSLKDTNITLLSAQASHTITSARNKSLPHRHLQGDTGEVVDATELAHNASLVTVAASTGASTCPDEVGIVHGPFAQACLCLDKENPKSAQCAIEFYREAANGNGTDDGDEDDDSENTGVASLWLGLLALIGMLCFVMRTQKREEESIDELKHGLMPSTCRSGHRM
jgi:hypothetical protein